MRCTPTVSYPHSADVGLSHESKHDTQYERPGTAGSSSRRHRHAKTRGPAPAQRRINRTQALRSVPATRFAAGLRVWACTRFCPLPPSAKLSGAMINTS